MILCRFQTIVLLFFHSFSFFSVPHLVLSIIVETIISWAKQVSCFFFFFVNGCSLGLRACFCEDLLVCLLLLADETGMSAAAAEAAEVEPAGGKPVGVAEDCCCLSSAAARKSRPAASRGIVVVRCGNL
jgi:hypothetical protein